MTLKGGSRPAVLLNAKRHFLQVRGGSPMSNSDQLSNRLLFLRQVHCELVERLAQLKKLREMLRTAERKAGAQMRIIHASKYAAAAGQTATHPSHIVQDRQVN
jgi:hypothetical protein